MSKDLESIQREGYTAAEARLIQLVQEHCDDPANETFAKRYRMGQYSLKDVVQILAPRVLADTRIEIDEKVNAPTTCKVWRFDRLVFDGQDKTALLQEPRCVECKRPTGDPIHDSTLTVAQTGESQHPFIKGGN